MDYTLNIRGRLLSLETPLVMGILNVTPDSFYAGSRAMSDEAIAQRAQTLVGEGAAIIDIGGCSTGREAPLPPRRRRPTVCVGPWRL